MRSSPCSVPPTVLWPFLTLAAALVLAAGCNEKPAPAAGDGQKAVPTEDTQPPVDPQAQKPVEDAKETTSAPEQARTTPEQPVVEVQPVTLAAGTEVAGALETTVSTAKSRVGDAVTVRVGKPVVVAGRTVVPVGAIVHGAVTHVKAAGRMKGSAELTVRFTEIELPGGQRYDVTCEPVRRVVKGDGKETAAEIGGGAAVGGVLGGVLGGKDDVLKGAAIGAAVGTGVAAATKGDEIVLPAGQSIQVRLAAPVTFARGTTS